MECLNPGTITTGYPQGRSIARSSRVLNYDLARWVTELRSQLQSKQHTLVLDMEEAPLPRVLCDRMQLRQVLVSLITGAHTSTDAGGQIAVSVRAGGGSVTVAVTVPGTRLRAAARKGFQPFARRIVEAHGGTVCVEGDPASGRTFAFTIPVHVARSTSALSWSAA